MKRTYENIPDQVQAVRGEHRDQMETLRSRLGLLSGMDKVLMTMYVKNGISFRQIARIRGVSETSVARRVHKLARRLTDGQYISCLRNRTRLTPSQMAIAKDFFLTGLAMSRIAAKRSSSVHRVRKTLRKVRDLVGVTAHEGGRP